jgi:hypothetical protein
MSQISKEAALGLLNSVENANDFQFVLKFFHEGNRPFGGQDELVRSIEDTRKRIDKRVATTFSFNPSPDTVINEIKEDQKKLSEHKPSL